MKAFINDKAYEYKQVETVLDFVKRTELVQTKKSLKSLEPFNLITK